VSQEQLNLLITAKNQLSPVLSEASGDVDKFKKSLISLKEQGLDALNGTVTKVADVLKTSFIAGVVALIGVMGASTMASIKFNEQMANVASLMPGATARVEELKKSVQNIAIVTGKSTDDISQGLYQVISAFGDTADSAKILEINAKSAMAGLASTTDAINLTSAVTKAYGDTSAVAVQKASDLALMTVRLGQTTFPELAASVGRVTPLMKSLGGSQEELFAVMATMTGVTGGAAEVSTQLAGALQSVMAPSKNTADLMKKLGFANGEAMIKSLGLQGSIKKLVDEAKKTNQPLQNFIGSIEGQILALGLAGPQAEDYKNKLMQMGAAAGATDAAFREQTQGINLFGFIIRKVQSQLQVLSQILGDKIANRLAPYAEEFSEFLLNLDIQGTIDKFKMFYGILIDGAVPMDQLSGKTAMVADALQRMHTIGKIVFTYFREHTDQLNALFVGFAGAGVAILAGAMGLLAINVLLAAAPFIILAAIIGGVYLAWVNQAQIIDFIKGKFNELKESVIDPLIIKFNEFKEKIQDIWTTFSKTQEFSLFKQTFEAVSGAVQNLIPFVIVIAGIIGVYLFGALQLGIYAFQQLYPIILSIWGSLIELFNALQPIIQIVLAVAVTIATALFPVFMYLGTLIVQLIAAFGWMLSGIITILTGIINFIVGVFTGNWNLAFQGIIQIIGGFIKFVWGYLSIFLAPFRALWDGVVNLFGTFSLIETGKNLLQGLIDGVSSMAGSLIQAVSKPVQEAIDKAKNLLGIRSPSRVFAEMGVNMVLGMAGGIDKTTPMLAQSSENIAQTSINAAQSTAGQSNSVSNNKSVTIERGAIVINGVQGVDDSVIQLIVDLIIQKLGQQNQTAYTSPGF
jgi:TP901 family phage tail tape measure protein